jgi:uncharacterized protein
MLRPFICALSVILGAGLVPTASARTALRITVYGGSGNIGRRIVHEALARGHSVTVVVRDPMEVTEHSPHLGVVRGDVLDQAQLTALLKGQDVVIDAVSFRKPPDPTGYRRAAVALVTTARVLGPHAPRLIFVGGAGSLEDTPGVLAVERIPPAYRGEVLGQKDALEYLRSVSDVPWTYFSPAFSIVPGSRTGQFRLGGDQLVKDDKGDSRISMEDYAVATLDEAEKPAHLHRRFTIGY